jgi:hypothetical protein
MQRRYISKKLATPLILEIPKISLERKEEEKILWSILKDLFAALFVLIELFLFTVCCNEKSK